MAFNVMIETIPYSKMRYPTPGDYYWSHDNTLIVQVAELGDWRYEYLVALHELEEVTRCRHRGISVKEIEDFDLHFERNRTEDDNEPGHAVGCPYRREHREASATEFAAAMALDVDWDEYCEAFDRLEWPADRPIDSRHTA